MPLPQDELQRLRNMPRFGCIWHVARNAIRVNIKNFGCNIQQCLLSLGTSQSKTQAFWYYIEVYWGPEFLCFKTHFAPMMANVSERSAPCWPMSMVVNGSPRQGFKVTANNAEKDTRQQVCGQLEYRKKAVTILFLVDDMLELLSGALLSSVYIILYCENLWFGNSTLAAYDWIKWIISAQR